MHITFRVIADPPLLPPRPYAQTCIFLLLGYLARGRNRGYIFTLGPAAVLAARLSRHDKQLLRYAMAMASDSRRFDLLAGLASAHEAGCE